MGQMISIVKMLSIQLEKNKKNHKIFHQMIRKIQEIKCLKDDSIFEESFREIMFSPNYSFPKIREIYICGNLFPKTAKEMDKRPTFKISNDFYVELRWLTFLFSIFSSELTDIIENRKKIDACILFSKYEEALEILNKIEEVYGMSFWLLENKCFLYNKLNKNTADFFSDWPDDMNSVIARYFELKSQDNRTNKEYQHFVNKEIKSLERIAEGNVIIKELLPYYNYRISGVMYELNKDNIMPILKMVETNSLIDCYLFCLELFKTVFVIKEESIRQSVEKCIHKIKGVKDEQLEVLRFCFDKSKNRKEYILKSKLDTAKNKFINGELEKSREAAIAILKKTPYNVQAVNLLVEVDILLGIDNEKEFEETVIGDMINSLMVIYSMREERNDRIDDVLKLLNSCSQSNWAELVAQTISERCRLVNTEDDLISKQLEYLQYLDIDAICYCLPRNDALACISEITNRNEYTDFREAILKEDYKKAREKCKLRELRQLINVCDPQIEMQMKREQVDKIRYIRSPFSLLMLQHYFIKLDMEDEFLVALEFAVDLMIDNIYTSLFIPIDQFIERIEGMDSEICSNICIPILYYIKYRYFKRDLKAEVCANCEDFLHFSKIGLPSRMENCDERFGLKRIIFFLRYVCTTEILSTALAATISNSMDLAQERLEICLLLCKKDVDNVKIYEQEIREITQKKKINSELRIIQENRIHVNIEGMRQELIDNYKNEFLRFQLYDDNSLKELIKKLENNKSKKQSIMIFQWDSARVLKELVLNIRDAFVSSNEYGLDGYLSLNIRHGAITDALRSPLSTAGLLTVYNSKNKEYELNPAWKCGDGDYKNIYGIIEHFTRETDTIIDNLRNVYIRISTERVQTKGIFDYTISEEEHRMIFNKSREFSEIDDFLNYLFDFLWDKTEANLQKIKELLKGEILSRYIKALSTLKREIEKVNNKNVTAKMLREIVEASSDMPNVINKVCFWFQRSTESKHTDFDLEFVFNMGLETIASMHPDTFFEPIKVQKDGVESTNDVKIEGKYLKLYSDIFYNLFDNIYKRAARRGRNKVCIEYTLGLNKKRQYIFLQNDYDCSGCLEEDYSKLKELKMILSSEAYLNRVRGEGGTGIPKICKIICVDLKRIGHIDFGIKEEENKFFIEIEM